MEFTVPKHSAFAHFDPTVDLSQHAARRAQQRGIQHDAMATVMRYHDVVLHVGAGCRSICLSRQTLASLLHDGVPASLVDRAANVILIVDDDTGEVITVMHDRGNRARRHRRQWDTRKRRTRVAGRAGSPRRRWT